MERNLENSPVTFEKLRVREYAGLQASVFLPFCNLSHLISVVIRTTKTSDVMAEERQNVADTKLIHAAFNNGLTKFHGISITSIFKQYTLNKVRTYPPHISDDERQLSKSTSDTPT